MAKLVTCKIQSTQAKEVRRGVSAVITYVVSMDAPTVGQQVIARAQGAQPPNDQVQRVDATMDIWIDESGTPVHHVDNALEVDEVVASQSRTGTEGRLHWLVVVTYKNPSLRAINIPVDQKENPLTREWRFKVESLVLSEERAYGKNLQDIVWPWSATELGPPVKRKKGLNGPVTNAAGHRYGPLPVRQRRLPIFVLKRNVSSPFSWIGINAAFENKVNANVWNVFNTGKLVSPRSCFFYSIETSEDKRWGGRVYYELEARVLYDPRGHDIRVANVGDKYWRETTANGKKQFVLETPQAGGVPVQPPVFLNDDGGVRANQDGIADDLLFRDLEERDFKRLTSRIAALT
jgi:hypothetical protein